MANIMRWEYRQAAAWWSNVGLRMDIRLKYLVFDFALGVYFDYLIHGSGGWGGVSGIFFSRLVLKGSHPGDVPCH